MTEDRQRRMAKDVAKLEKGKKMERVKRKKSCFFKKDKTLA